MRPQGRPNWTGPSFPHHSGKAAGLELPFPSPLYLSGARGGWLGPENSQRCDGEGACWPEPALPKPLLRFRAFSIPDLTGSSHPQGHHPPATNIRSHQIMGLYSTSITHSQFYWTWGPGVVQWGRVNRGGLQGVAPVFKRPAILEQRLHELRQLYQKVDFVKCFRSIICKCYRRPEGIKGPVTRGLPEGGCSRKALGKLLVPSHTQTS